MSFKNMIYAFLILLGLYGLFTVGAPFLLAFIVAFLLEPVILALNKKAKIKRGIASPVVCTFFILAIITLGYFLIVKVFKEGADLINFLLTKSQGIYLSIGQITAQYQELFQSLPPEYQDSLLQFTTGLYNTLQSILTAMAGFFFNIAKEVPNIFIETLIIVIALYLISMRLPQMKQSFLQFFDPQTHDKLNTVLGKLQNAIFGFILGQLFISFIIFLVVLAGFLILGIGYPSALALLITLVDILPIVGTGSVMIPMAVYYAFTGNYFLAIGLVIHYVIIVIIRRIIEPKILSQTIGIGALSILVSLYVGVKLTGFIGLFLGPATVIIFQSLINVGIFKIKIKL